MQARDREPLRCVPTSAPTHASSMPELPPPPYLIGQQSASASLSSPSADATEICGNPSINDPPTPTSRRVRFQGDDPHAVSSSSMPLNNPAGTPPSPSSSRPQVPRSRSLQPEEVASTSWGMFNLFKHWFPNIDPAQ